MISRLILPLAVAAPLAAVFALAAGAQVPILPESATTAAAQIDDARRQSNAARQRAERLESEARRITDEAERTAANSAAVAARIQQTEADIRASEARVALIGDERSALLARLAERQRPLVRLTAALQRLSRRPPALALLKPGSVRETVYMRALLETTLPQIEARTAELRTEIAAGRALAQRSAKAAQALRLNRERLTERQKALAAIETRQRLASREATALASREAERALALTEKARDLSDLMDDISQAGSLRKELAALPGPVLRPARPGEARVRQSRSRAETANLQQFLLPLDGRLVAGFGERIEGRPQSRGLVLSASPRAQAVAPARGRVAFAGPYSGYGQIVVIEHAGEWTSLVTGLTRLDVRVGERVIAGSPIGLTGPGDPIVTLELRRDGEPINPLPYVRGGGEA